MFTYKQGFFLRTISYSEMKSTPLIVRSICYVNSLTSNIMIKILLTVCNTFCFDLVLRI